MLAESIDAALPMGRIAQMVEGFAEFERVVICGRIKAKLSQLDAECRISDRSLKLNAKQRADIAESVVSVTKAAVEMARIFGISSPTVSRTAVMVRYD